MKLGFETRALKISLENKNTSRLIQLSVRKIYIVGAWRKLVDIKKDTQARHQERKA